MCGDNVVGDILGPEIIGCIEGVEFNQNRVSLGEMKSTYDCVGGVGGFGWGWGRLG